MTKKKIIKITTNIIKNRNYNKLNKISKLNKLKQTNKINNINNNINTKFNNNLYPINLNLTVEQIEFILLYSTIINYLLLLIKNKIPNIIIKKTILNLFKDIKNHNHFIKKNTSDIQLDILYEKLFKQAKQIKKHSNNQNNQNNENIQKIQYKLKHKGGFYFKSLEEKGDQPLTGTDLSTLLDEMQQFFYNAQYTDEGKFLQDTNALVSMFRGDLGQFKGLLQYRIFPQYYSIIPPFIKWNESSQGAKDGIKHALENRKYEDLPDYLLAYQSYLRSRDEYLVAKGLKSPSVLGKDRYTGFFDKLAHSLDKNITKFQQYRNKATGRISPIALPV